MAGIAEWLQSPPVFAESGIKTRRAELLNSSLNNVLILIPLMIIGNLLGARTRWTEYIFDMSLLPLVVVSHWLMRKGFVDLSATILIVFSELFLSLVIANIGTIRCPSTSMFLLIVVIGGLLYGRSGLMLTGFTSSLLIGTLAIAERAGILPNADHTVTVTQWVAYTVIIFWMGSLIVESIQAMSKALERGDKELAERIRSQEELHKNEAKRRQVESELAQSQRMESLGILASGVAHDFNNILNIILGHASLLEDHRSSPDVRASSIGAIEKASNRGTALVQQLLTYARKGESRFEPLSVNNLLLDLQRLLVETFPRSIAIATDFTPANPTIMADATLIHQVFMNICLNARDAMPKGGLLRISTTGASEQNAGDKALRISGSPYVLITVSDSGIGMDEETKRRIFEPFFTTKGPGKGTGLGLALVYSIMDSHHGFISVESTPGVGTTFSMFFPEHEQRVVAPNIVTPPRPETLTGTETILVIEDEDLLINIVTRTLEDKGYRFISATDGEMGVSKFIENRETICAVLTDYGLPKLTGEEVFLKIRECDPDAKVVIVTGFLDPMEKSRLLKAGVCHIIPKPFTMSEVLVALRSAIDSQKILER